MNRKSTAADDATIDEQVESVEESPEQQTEQPQPQTNSEHNKSSKFSFLKRLAHLPKKWVALCIVVLLAIIGAVLLLTPLGYPIIGSIFTRDIQIDASDSTLKLAVKDITVEVDGKAYELKGEGPYTLRKAHAGKHTIKITRQFYEDFTTSITIKPLDNRRTALVINADLKPTGRPVSVLVKNLITDQPIEGATVSYEESSATTSATGEATLLVPSALSITPKVDVKKDGYNTTSAELSNDNTVSTIKLTPSGRAYFFSKRTGKIDLYSSNLDGSDPQVVLAGTGNEDETEYLVASPDRRWLAFTSTRDGDKDKNGNRLAKLFIFDTSTNSLVTADEGDARFTIHDWTRQNTLVYQVQRNPINDQYQFSDRDKLKIFHPDSSKIDLLFSNKDIAPNPQAEWNSGASLGSNQSLFGAAVLQDYIVYVYTTAPKYYSYSVPATYTLIATDLSGKQTAEITSNEYISGVTKISDNQATYQHESSTKIFDATSGKSQKLDSPVVARKYGLKSPDGSKIVWSESRDGQEIIFTGGAGDTSETRVATRKTNAAFSWYTDDYVLYNDTDESSALYIVSANGGAPIKISDIHTARSYRNF